MYYSAIGLIAILVLLIVNQDILFCRGKSGDIPAWKVYRGFLYAVMAYYLTDILWGVFESRKLRIPLFADTTVYFAAMAAGVLLWAEFTVAYLEEKNSFGQFLIIAGRVIAGLIALLALINLFEPILFTVDSNCVYRALAARYVILAFQILLLMMIFVYAFSSMKRSDAADGKSPRYRALGLFSLIMAVFLVLQLFFPSLPFYSIAYLARNDLYQGQQYGSLSGMQSGFCRVCQQGKSGRRDRAYRCADLRCRDGGSFCT